MIQHGEHAQGKHTPQRRASTEDGHHRRASELWHKLEHWLRLDELSPAVRKIVVGVVGGTLLLVGMAMIVLPGPAFIVIPLALALLGTEFVWARYCVQKARNLLSKAKNLATSR